VSILVSLLHRLPALAWLLPAIVLGLALRLPTLESRPMHNDEAVQAAKTGALFDRNDYAYDPHEFHGPSLYYFTLPALWFSSAKSYAASSEWHYRIVPIVFGIALILLLLFIKDGIGISGLVSAGVLTAASPAMVFYSRYYIQEIPLVFFSFAVIACGWRYLNRPSFRWALMTGLFAGLMYATKETCAIVFFSMAIALVTNHCFFSTSNEAKVSTRHVVAACCVAALIALIFYTSFFTHARGPLDSVLAFERYLTRSGAPSKHDKPAWYYLKLITWMQTAGAPIWTEAFIIALAGIGAVPAFFRRQATDSRNTFARFMSIYTLCLIAVYSLISYKTPWCALGFLHGLIVLAGIGAARVWDAAPHWSMKLVATLVFTAGAAHLGWQAYQASGRFNSDARNPYVYAHASTDAVRLCKRIEDLAAVHPDGLRMNVKVMVPHADYWPLPWYLRRLERVGFWDSPPAQVDAPVIVASTESAAELALEMKGTYQKNQYGLRPGVRVWLYVDESLWKSFLAERQTGNRK